MHIIAPKLLRIKNKHIFLKTSKYEIWDLTKADSFSTSCYGAYRILRFRGVCVQWIRRLEELSVGMETPKNEAWNGEHMEMMHCEIF